MPIAMTLVPLPIPAADHEMAGARTVEKRSLEIAGFVAPREEAAQQKH